MTDITNYPPPRPRAERADRAEFVVYFALIFLLALPSSTYGWARDVARRRTLNLLGPLARAWIEAGRVTPMIFRV